MTGNALLDDEQLRAALAALGLTQIRSADPARSIDHGVLLGMLLGLIESAIMHDLGDATADSLISGHRWMVAELADQDQVALLRRRALLHQNRLHRTADELREAAGNDALGLVATAAPALLAAANLLGLLHHAAPGPGHVSTTVATARANLATASTALDRLDGRLRRAGFDV